MNDRNSVYSIASSMHDDFATNMSATLKMCIENKLAGNKSNNSKIVESKLPVCLFLSLIRSHKSASMAWLPGNSNERMQCTMNSKSIEYNRT